MLSVIQPQELAPMEGLDHLFLLPERVLAMDTKNLQKDLAGLDFDARLLHEAPMGNVWLSGSRPSSATREPFAYPDSTPLLTGNVTAQLEDREAKIKSFKERQNEERQKKLDEMKSQALAAQRFKEQKEHERRQRLDELRLKEDERRQQVEERKRAINRAERDRLESIIKRNQEREVRTEAKRRNERSSLVFAFGSSTPRMLAPVEGVSSSFWGHRRATSTQNITYSAAPLTRRQSERELDGGSKKRATSAGGLERSGEATTPQHPAGCISGYVGRRRTDLMPTIPSKESPSTPPRKPFMRSPGRAYSMSRLDQLAKPRKRPAELPTLAETTSSPSFRPLSRPQQSSVSRSMSHLAVGKLGLAQPQKPLRKADSRSMHQLSTAVPLPPPRTTRASELRQRKLTAANSSNQVEAHSRPSSSLSQQSTSSVTSSVTLRSRPIAAPRRQRPVSIAVTGITSELKNGIVDPKKPENKPPLPKSRKSSLAKSQEKIMKKKSLSSPTEGSPKAITSPTAPPVTTIESPVSTVQVQIPIDKETKIINSNDTKEKQLDDNDKELIDVNSAVTKEVDIPENNEPVAQLIDLEQDPLPLEVKQVDPKPKETDLSNIEKADVEKEVGIKPESEITLNKPEVQSTVEIQPQPGIPAVEIQSGETDMTASMSSKPRITTEEEAKAALAERRRIAREEAEKQAEMERLRIEEEIRLELERQQREEEQQRQLIELQRVAEEERLKEAIKEAQKREEEEKLRREEEQRLKLLKEEAERKAREEAERQKAELQERLKNEEKEREARRKRVEAIMLRTRGKNNTGSSPQTEEKNAENKLDSKVNGSKTDMAENGHKNGKDIETVDNIIPVDTIKNANTVTATTLSTDDTLNSNDAWQRNSQTDLLM